MHIRGGSFASFKTGNVQFQDSMMVDGLQDAFSGVPMGTTAERVAHTYHIERDQQDAFAVASHTHALHAISNGYFADEIVPVCVADLKHSRPKQTNGHVANGNALPNGSAATRDENPHAESYIRADECPRASTVEALRRLPTVFDKTSGASVTAGNSSSLADGAACLLLAGENEVAKRALHPQAKIVSWAQSGVDPALMGIGPVQAIKKAVCLRF